MNNSKQQLGQKGEDLAAQYLRAQGYKIVMANFRIREGEVDLVVQKNGVLVFVEVKSRHSECFGGPLEAVNKIKLQKLIKVALTYDREYNWNGPFRIDAIGINWNTCPGPKIEHLKNVLS